MKTPKLLSLLMLAFASALAFTSCSGGDDDNNPADDLAGSFSGWTEMTYGTKSTVFDATDHVTITSNANGSATVTLKSDNFGTITIPSASVTKSGSKYTVIGPGSVTFASASGLSGDHSCTLNGTVSTSKDDFTLTYTVPSLNGGTTLVFQDGTSPIEKVIAGSYDGWTIINSGYFNDLYTDNEIVKVTANDNGTVDVSYTHSTYGTCLIEGANVSKSNDVATIKGSGKITMNGKEYASTFTGTVKTDKSEAEMTFDIPTAMEGMDITFYSGDTPVSVIVSGTYTGNSTENTDIQTGLSNDNDVMTITKVDDSHVALTYTSEAFGTATFENIAVSTTESGYEFASSAGTISITGQSGTTTYDCTISGTMGLSKGTWAFNINVPKASNANITFANK